MKKSFLCLLALLWLSVSSAFGLTLLDKPDSGLTVSLYGQLTAEARWVHLHLDGEPGKLGFNDGIYQPSYVGLGLDKRFGGLRLGLRGEVEAVLDSLGQQKIRARRIMIDLEGRWGTLAFGRQITPQFELLNSFDPHQAITDGGMGTSWLSTRLGNNLFSYTTPAYNGLSLKVAYSPDLLWGSAIRESGWPRLSYFVLSPRYQSGKFSAAVNLGVSNLHGDLVWDGLAIERGRVYFMELFGSYDFGLVKIISMFSWRFPDNIDNLSLLTTPMIVPDAPELWTVYDSWVFMLGGELRIPNGDLFALTWAYRKANIPDRGAARLDRYSAAYYHDFNENLTAYAGYTILLNNWSMNEHPHFWGGLFADDGRYRGSLYTGLRFIF